jgi:hypothetical protein
MKRHGRLIAKTGRAVEAESSRFSRPKAKSSTARYSNSYSTRRSARLRIESANK